MTFRFKRRNEQGRKPISKSEHWAATVLRAPLYLVWKVWPAGWDAEDVGSVMCQCPCCLSRLLTIVVRYSARETFIKLVSKHLADFGWAWGSHHVFYRLARPLSSTWPYCTWINWLLLLYLGSRVAFHNQEPMRISSFCLSGLVRQQHLITLGLDRQAKDARSQVAFDHQEPCHLSSNRLSGLVCQQPLITLGLDKLAALAQDLTWGAKWPVTCDLWPLIFDLRQSRALRSFLSVCLVWSVNSIWSHWSWVNWHLPRTWGTKWPLTFKTIKISSFHLSGLVWSGLVWSVNCPWINWHLLRNQVAFDLWPSRALRSLLSVCLVWPVNSTWSHWAWINCSWPGEPSGLWP